MVGLDRAHRTAPNPVADMLRRLWLCVSHRNQWVEGESVQRRWPDVLVHCVAETME